MPERAELIEELQRLRDVLGRVPKTADVNECSPWSHQPFYREFDSWDGAITAAGMEPENKPVAPFPRADRGDLIEEINRLAEALGRVPSSRDMDKFGKYSSSSVDRKFDGWNGGVKAANLEPQMESVGERGWNRDDFHYEGSWHEARERAIERDKSRCVDCGVLREENQEQYGRDLDVHHKKPIDEFGDPDLADMVSNLVTLCPRCHGKREN